MIHFHVQLFHHNTKVNKDHIKLILIQQAQYLVHHGVQLNKSCVTALVEYITYFNLFYIQYGTVVCMHVFKRGNETLMYCLFSVFKSIQQDPVDILRSESRAAVVFLQCEGVACEPSDERIHPLHPPEEGDMTCFATLSAGINNTICTQQHGKHKSCSSSLP